MGYKVSDFQDEKVLKVCFPSMGSHLMPQNYTKIVKIVSFTLFFTLKNANISECLGGSVDEGFAFGSGHDPRVLGWSPTSGSLLSRVPASPSPSAAHPACALLPSVK